MVCASAAVAPHRRHGPVASALKWAFKRCILARQSLDDVIAEARAEVEDTAPDTRPVLPIAGGETETHDGPCVRWITSDAAEHRAVEELSALLARDDGFVWVDIPRVDDATEHLLTDVFKFHPLAVRDTREPGHVPKVHAYADYLFVMLQIPEWEPGGQIRYRELNQFAGSRYLVTVHERTGAAALAVEDLETSAVLCRIDAGRAHPRTPAELSYAVTTRLSVHMEALVSELARSAAALNQSLRGGRGGVSSRAIDEMFELRDALLAVETVAAQNHAICARMATLTGRREPTGPHPLIADVLDQLVHIQELCRANRELLQGVLDFSRTRATTQMDRAMSRLALLGAVALPVGVIADLHGMNVLVFEQMQLNILAMALGAAVILALGMLRLTRG